MLSNSEDETKKIAIKLAKGLKGGDVVLLSGDLGAGKTVFAKGIAKGLGLKCDITSPTFTIMKGYTLPAGGSFEHIDAYRLNGLDEALEIGLDEAVGEKNTICVIEWPEKILGLFNEKAAYKVDIKKVDDDKREVVFL